MTLQYAKGLIAVFAMTTTAAFFAYYSDIPRLQGTPLNMWQFKFFGLGFLAVVASAILRPTKYSN